MNENNPYESPREEPYRVAPQKSFYWRLFDHLSVSKQIVFWIIVLAWIVLGIFGIASDYRNP